MRRTAVLILALGALVRPAAGTGLVMPGPAACPVFVTDPDPADPVWGHCSLRRGPALL